jgi:phosphopantetheine--protein transferase-like protein
MILGVGTDILRASRISSESIRTEESFLMRSFTEKERSQANACGTRKVSYYATRFAAKEAVYKAISFCEAGFDAGEIEILDDCNGKPFAVLSGSTRASVEKAARDGYVIHISLSYDTEYIVAFAVAEMADKGSSSDRSMISGGERL